MDIFEVSHVQNILPAVMKIIYLIVYFFEVLIAVIACILSFAVDAIATIFTFTKFNPHTFEKTSRYFDYLA